MGILLNIFTIMGFFGNSRRFYLQEERRPSARPSSPANPSSPARPSSPAEPTTPANPLQPTTPRQSEVATSQMDANVISDIVQNENFYTISQVAVVSNAITNDNEVDANEVLEEDGIGEEDDEDAFDNNFQVPSTFGIIEETNMTTDNNWIVTQLASKNDFTQELGKDSFKDKEELIRAIKLYSIRTHKPFEVVETRPTLWTIRCKLHLQSGCKWQVRAIKRKRSGYFEITKYMGPHTCLYNNISQDHPNLDGSLIAQETKHLIKEQPSISIPALRAEIVDKLGYIPSYKKVWTGKQKAIEQVFGNWEESYSALPKFLCAVQKFNPGTIVEWLVSSSTNEEPMEFRRVFWAFAPSIKGFVHCRPVISIDGTHLYGKYKGTMMIAMGVDGNNQILPLAFAIVENESYDSWNWFLSYIKIHVVKEREGICLISDRHLGILKAVNQHGSPWLEPRGFHRYCLRHFINNFYEKFRNSELKGLAYRAGSQNQVRKFNSTMEEIGKLNPQARQWLESHPLDRWTLAHDGGRRYGLLTTNLSEIFNSVLKGARFLPITACVQLTFYRLVHYFEVRRPLGNSSRANGDAYTPHVLVKQVALMSKASAHSLRSFNREKGIFELITQRGRNVQVVNLEQKTCTCGKWEVFKYPCSHVLSACATLSLNSWQYVDKCYSIVKYCDTWASEFSPLPHEAYWPQSLFKELLPNFELLRNKKGRPRSTRLRNGMDIKEGRKANLCGICKQSGHNRKKCPSKPR
uniref:SWIM-type domain-containing protein n=1 Tax=Lactuca sativa TaxID=4236 RepID=A0A9R1VYY7_LACSA|nr:hypothetical protein LSAT_V11C400197080 [Lactuca sativa]